MHVTHDVNITGEQQNHTASVVPWQPRTQVQVEHLVVTFFSERELFSFSTK